LTYIYQKPEIIAIHKILWRVLLVYRIRDISSRNSLAVEGKEWGVNGKISADDYTLLSLGERTERAVRRRDPEIFERMKGETNT